MARVIKIKRSGVAAKMPAITDLELGELAMNTTDGRLFMKKSVSGVESVVEIGPLILAGKPTDPNQAATKQYVDDFQPFLNLPPRAGYPSRQDSVAEIPVYADFKFSRKISFSPAPLVVDDEDREVIYWPCSINNSSRCFPASRYGAGQELVYNNNPIAPPCLEANEALLMVYNAGTHYVDVPTVNTDTGIGSRRLLIKTNGKSDPATWTDYFNISEGNAGIGTSFNAGYAYEKTTDRIIRLSYLDNDATKIIFQIFDSNLNKLGPAQQLFSFWDDVDFVSGANGRLLVGGSIGFLSQTLPLAYDSHNEVLYSVFALAVNVTDADGSNPHSENCVCTLAYSIPKSTLLTGTGPITNLNPPHTGFNYRYWHHTDSTSVGLTRSWALPINLAFDSYYNNLNVNASNGWEDGINNTFFQLPCTGKIYNTITPEIGANYAETISLPDASPWAKRVFDDMFIMGDSIQFVGGDKGGNYVLQSKFYPDQLGSAIGAGEAIKLVPNTWAKTDDLYPAAILKVINNTQYFTAVVQPDKSVKNYTLGVDQTTIYEMTVGADGKWILTNTGVQLPPVPSDNYWFNRWTWNGNAAAPVFYYLIVWGANPQAATEKDYVKIATWKNGVFAVNPVTPGKYAFDTSNNTYAGAGARVHRIHTMLYTESGNVMTGISTLYAYGGAYGSMISRLTPDGTITDVTSVNPYSASVPHIGYHPSFGYYVSCGSDPNIIAAIVCSKRAGTSDVALSEADFFTPTHVGTYTKYNTITATVGLVAYITTFPLFLGGYFSMIPNLSVSLTPNANNYIYLRRDPNDRTNIIATVLVDQVLPNSFSRILISKVVTNSQNVVTSTNYPV